MECAQLRVRSSVSDKSKAGVSPYVHWYLYLLYTCMWGTTASEEK